MGLVCIQKGLYKKKMSVLSELSNPALQDQESLITFSHFDIKEFDENSVDEVVSAIEKMRERIDCLPLPRSAVEFYHYVSNYIKEVDELNYYCDRILDAIRDGELKNIIQEHLVKRVRSTWLNASSNDTSMTSTSLFDRKKDRSTTWKKRSEKIPLVLSEHTGLKDRNVSNLKMNDVWVVPKFKVAKPCFVKPTYRSFTVSLFRKWIGSVANKLRASIKKKSQLVVGSESARFLYMLTNPSILHQARLRHALVNSDIYVYDFSTKRRVEPTEWMISDFMPIFEKKPAPRVLHFGNKIMTQDNILEFESLFKRHKPRYIAASKYLSGLTNPVLPVLQKEIDIVYEASRPQPLMLSGVAFDKEKVMKNVKVIPRLLYKLCMRHFSGDKSVHFGDLQHKFSKLPHTILQSGLMANMELNNVELLEPDEDYDMRQFKMCNFPAWFQPEMCSCRAHEWSECVCWSKISPETQAFLESVHAQEKDHQEFVDLLESEKLATRLREHDSDENPDCTCNIDKSTCRRKPPSPLEQAELANKLALIKAEASIKAEIAKTKVEAKQEKILDSLSSQAVPVPLRSLTGFGAQLVEKRNLTYVYELLRSLNTAMENCEWKELAKIIMLLLTLHQQTSWKGCVATLASYALATDLKWWEAALKRLSSFTAPTFQYQEGSVSEEVPKGSSFWEILTPVTEWGKALWDCVIELMWGVIMPSIMPTELWSTFSGSSYTSEMLNRIKSEVMKISAKSIAEVIVQSFLQILQLIKKCINLKSLKPLFTDVFDPYGWKVEVNAVLVYYSEIQISNDQPTDSKRWNQLKAEGAIPAHWYERFTPVALNEHITKLVSDGEAFAASFRNDLILLSDIRSSIKSLKALQEANSIGYGVMGQRVQPFGVYMSGVAGSGKTNLTDAIFRSIGRANGYSIEPTMKYSWQRGVNFQDSLGYTQWCITLDDIDVSPAPATMGFESHVDAVIRIINNAPLVVEQSRVEAKGKVASKPLLVMMTSNFTEPRLQNYALQPTRMAFFRRFPVWVEVKAKKEFGDNGVLNPQLASKSEDGEVYDLKVSIFDPSIVSDFPYQHLPEIDTKAKLLIYLIARYRVHIDRQLQMLTNSYTSDSCPICYADWIGDKRCSCVQTTQMKWEWMVLPMSAFALYRWLPPIIQREKIWIESIKNSIDVSVKAIQDTSLLARQMTTEVKLTKKQFDKIVDGYLNFEGKYFAMGLVSLILLDIAWVYYKDYRDNQTTSIPQAIERNAVAGAPPSAWVRAPQEFSPGMPVEFSTFTKDEAILHIRQSYVDVRSWRGAVKGLVVCNNGLICPLHVFSELGQFVSIPESSDLEFQVVQKGIVHKLLYNAFNVTQIASDAVFIKVPGLVGFTGVGKKLWTDIDNSVSQFDEAYLVREDELLSCAAMSTTFKSTRIIKCNLDTKLGDCGYAYLCRMNKHWKIVAIHNGVNDHLTARYAYGMMVTQNMMLSAASRLATTFQMLSIPLKQTGLNYEKQTFSYYPERSEVWTAVSQHGVQISPIGQANIKVHGSTMKSDITPTLYADEFEDLEEKYCGRRDYWQVPNFKGEMRDGKWVSPFSNSLTPLMRVTHKHEFLYLCLAELLNGVEDLQTSGYSEISLEEAVVGIPGSIIQSADLKTSVGMPFNQPKTTKIVVRERQAFIDPYLMEITKEILDTVKEGVIPCPVVLCALKDEAISCTKNEAKRARVFNVLPYPFNWAIKAKMSPSQAFIRNNKGFFGSMVGINMTSLEINEVVRILQQTDPELDHILALDIMNEDKAEDGTLLDFVCLFYYAIQLLLTGKADEAYTLLQGLKSGVYIVKNDLFQPGAQNPSGQHMTVDFNDVVTSLALVYFYYRMKYPNGLPPDLRQLVLNYQRTYFQTGGIVPKVMKPFLTYRQHCSKATYGDDSLQGVSKKCEFYEPNLIPKFGLELGLVFTDESKSKDIRYKKITECSFLKRTFVWREDLQTYVGLLSKKTLVKMLRLRKKSTLTHRDHAAEQLTNVMRELAYDTREEFEEFDERLYNVAIKYELDHNAYYRRLTYDEHFEKMKDGSFSTWAPLSVEEIEQGKITLQMSANTSIDLKPVIDEAKVVPLVGQVMSNELGWFHSAASSTRSGAPAGPPVSSLPKSQLGDFLQRSTYIGAGTMATTDAYGANIITIDPWKAFLESGYIAPKIEAYKYIRGTLEVQISVNAPAGAYGLYYLVAEPFKENPIEGSFATIPFYSPCVESVPHVKIDLAKCTDGKILLPWCHWNDYATLGDSTTAEGYAKMWQIQLKCYQAIGTGTGTDTPVGSFRIWARCTSDHDMVIPYTQMMPNSFDAARDMVSNEIDSTRDTINKTSMEATGMKPSGIAGAIATGATAVAAAVPFLAPFAGPAAAIASGVSAVLSWFGFTRETAQQTPTTLVRRNYSNVANMDCDDTSEIAALSKDNAISIDPRFISPSNEDEAAFNYLMSKWIMIGRTTWSPLDAAQDELISFPVTPFISSTAMETNAVLTVAGFLGFPFEYWRGDMEYMIVIPFSKFHRGVLQISWTPDAVTPVTDITNTRFNHIIDCSTCTDWTFSVGYASATPMLHNIPHLYGAAIPSSAGANGMVSITVANPLTSPVSTASTQIFVFARGCANMEFAVPRQVLRPTMSDGSLGAARDFATGFILQMSSEGAIGNDVAVMKSFNLVPGTSAPIKDLCSGERFDSVRGLVQKFSQDLRIQRAVALTTATESVINHFPSYPNINQFQDVVPQAPDITNTQYFTWCGYYSAMFTGVAASTRYKIVNNSGLDTAIGLSHKSACYGVNYNVSTTISSVNPLWSISNSEGVEITVPYYYNRKFFPTWALYRASDIIGGTARGRVDELYTASTRPATIGEGTNSFTGYVAYGPDVRFGMFRFLPGIGVSSSSLADAEGWNQSL